MSKTAGDTDSVTMEHLDVARQPPGGRLECDKRLEFAGGWRCGPRGGFAL